MIQEARALVRVPEVTGLPLRKAKLLVENSGLKLDAVLFQESYDERNTVLAQQPARGQMVYAGEKVTLSVSRESYAKWLPSIYQRSDVTGRNFLRDLLWITQHLFGAIEDTLDVIHTFFDPNEAPEEFLPWLASWTAMVLEEDWPKEKKRKLIKKSIELYKLRGTVKGLKLFIALFTGHEPEVKENEWPFRGFRVGATSVIGIDSVILPQVNHSHTFLVEMPVTYKDISVEAVIRLHEIIQMEKPANTSYCLRFLAEQRPVELREFFAIGLQSGINVGHEVVRPLPQGIVVEEEEDDRPTIVMKPLDAPGEETVDEFIAPPRARPPLPKAPKAENAPIEGQEVRTSLAGGFEQGARQMVAVSTIEFAAAAAGGASDEPTTVTPAALPAEEGKGEAPAGEDEPKGDGPKKRK